MKFAAVCMVLLFAIAGFDAPAFAQSQPYPAGSWQVSCRNASMNGHVLSAQCQTYSGNWQNTAIKMNQCPNWIVGNRNGTLFCEGGGNQYAASFPAGSWRDSCTAAHMGGNTLYATCNTGSGYQKTHYLMTNCPSWSLTNNYGNLTCENTGNWWGSTGFPGGSWQNSCTNARMRGNTLTASCTVSAGNYVTSSINVGRCPRRVVANRYGYLACD